MFTGLIRTIILYILIIAGVRLMGKRQVGELEPSELVLSCSSRTWPRCPCRISASRCSPE